MYIEAGTIEVEGKSSSSSTDPHSWVHVVGEETFGKRKAYAAEWASTSVPGRNGIT